LEEASDCDKEDLIDNLGVPISSERVNKINAVDIGYFEKRHQYPEKLKRIKFSIETTHDDGVLHKKPRLQNKTVFDEIDDELSQTKKEIYLLS